MGSLKNISLFVTLSIISFAHSLETAEKYLNRQFNRKHLLTDKTRHYNEGNYNNVGNINPPTMYRETTVNTVSGEDSEVSSYSNYEAEYSNSYENMERNLPEGRILNGGNSITNDLLEKPLANDEKKHYNPNKSSDFSPSSSSPFYLETANFDIPDRLQIFHYDRGLTDLPSNESSSEFKVYKQDAETHGCIGTLEDALETMWSHK